MDNSTFHAIRFWLGLGLFAYFAWVARNLTGMPTGLLECLAVGAMISGSLLFLSELGWRAMLDRGASEIDTIFAIGWLILALLITTSLFWHAISENKGWIISSLLVGASLYLVALRMPFVAVLSDT